MSDTPSDHRQAVALFRYGLIADLAQLPPGAKGLYDLIRAKSERDYVIPGSTRTRVASETLRDWLRRYRRGGFEALLPKPRAGRGRPRALPPQVVDVLLGIKEGNPKLSVQLVIREARNHPEVPPELPLPPATVHRLLARHGLMDRPTGEPGEAGRRRFAFQRAGEMWMSGVMHGPTVFVGGRKRKTYLIAFIDDATRVIPHCAFALAENTTTFLPVLKQAILKRGLPARLYVDNGSNYRSRHLSLVCARPGIALIHSRPYKPQGRGKIERWFKTVRAQFLTRLSAADAAGLEALNRRLRQWLESEYHQSPHRGLDGRTPLEQWALCGDEVRFLDPGLDLDDLFLFETQRKVRKDRTVSLHGVVYEVDAVLAGEKVTLRYDPSAPTGRAIQVWHEGKAIELAKPVQTCANCFVKRHRPSSTLDVDGPAPAPPPGLTLRALDDDAGEDA